ncbi:MAG: polysaccharide deacetylase family protein [Thermomicrobiales bacterium]
MASFRQRMRSLRVGATALLTLVMLVGCIGQDDRKEQGFAPLDLAERPTIVTPPTHAAETPTASGVGGVTGVLPPTSARTLSAAQLVNLQPNELGVIPVLMYHAFVLGPTDDEWTRTIDSFRDDLQWLYDHDFYVISVRDFINDQIAAPPGKHPVVLTFDDASARQFLFTKNAHGELVPSEESAVGVMEAFFAEHPDFGHTAMFALLPYNCFSTDSEYNTIDYCEQKLTWLADNGYEIANHTWGHQDLSNANADTVRAQIGQTIDFIDERVSGPGNLSRVLVLPYGAIPDPTVDWWAWSAVYEGFTWNGKDVQLEAVMNVTGGPMFSPASTAWSPLAIHRFNTEPGLLDYWFGELTNGNYTLYTSDGNPETVVVPDTMPDLMDAFDPNALALAGKTALTYDPASGEVAIVPIAPNTAAAPRVDPVAAYHRNRVAA